MPAGGIEMFPVLFTNRWNDLLPDLGELDRALAGPPARMAFDIREDQDGWVVEAEVPGLSKDDLNISVENGRLTVSGEVRRASDPATGSVKTAPRGTGAQLATPSFFCAEPALRRLRATIWALRWSIGSVARRIALPWSAASYWSWFRVRIASTVGAGSNRWPA